MKFVCLGYHDESLYNDFDDTQRNALMDACFAYDDELRANGHFAGGQALQGSEQAVTVRTINGKASVTDGPYAETREQLGGILILEANDLNHAIQLMSRHPGTANGPFEIRPAADLGDMVEASQQRRASGTA